MKVSLPVYLDEKSFSLNTAYALAVVFLMVIANKFLVNFIDEDSIISVAIFWISYQAIKEEGLFLLRGPIFLRITTAICLTASLFIGLLFAASFNI